MRKTLGSKVVRATTVALLAVLACTTSASADSGTTVTVMTQNLYFGADLSPVIAAPTPTAFFLAVAGAYNQGVASDWDGRAMQWAKEIAAGYDVEGPGLFPFGFTDVRLTQHDVILARQESRLKFANPQSGQYAARITIPTAVGPIQLPWAWTSVDATVGDHVFRFATTHLDPNSGAAQMAQAQEFLAGPGATSLPLVWAGDFNSDADATSITGNPPDTATYQNIVAAGLSDAWAVANPGDPGYTCCESAALNNALPTLSERIDHVFIRGPWQVTNVTVVGATAADKTAVTNLWPSDHAGVVGKLNLQGQS